MEELVWRKGEERCERTQRAMEKKTNQGETLAERAALTLNGQSDRSALTLAERAALTLNGGSGLVERAGLPLNKREFANSKINERYLVGQATQNPFMPNSNYANDLEVQMNFLTPQKGC